MGKLEHRGLSPVFIAYKITFWGINAGRRFSGTQRYAIVIDRKEGTANISSNANRTLFVPIGGLLFAL